MTTSICVSANVHGELAISLFTNNRTHLFHLFYWKHCSDWQIHMLTLSLLFKFLISFCLILTGWRLHFDETVEVFVLPQNIFTCDLVSKSAKKHCRIDCRAICNWSIHWCMEATAARRGARLNSRVNTPNCRVVWLREGEHWHSW